MYTRDFPIILCQIWGRRYQSFLGVEMKTTPQCIFHVKDGLVEAYRNIPDLHKEINSVFKEAISKDSKFFINFIFENSNKAKILQKIASKQNVTRLTLLKFCDDLCDLWQGIYASLNIPLDKTMELNVQKQAYKFRQETEQLEYLLFNYIFKSLKKLYPNFGEYSKYISWEELYSDVIPAKQVLEKRAQEQIIWKDKLISRSKFYRLQKELKFKLENNTNKIKLSEIKGQIAFRGKIRGHVKKIFKVSEVKNLKKGEILVTYMTIPDFLPAMKRAGAFVTDEGGITCHASIIAREMKKPCIIGTKIATQVLKDGDLVVVDANNGIVKKL